MADAISFNSLNSPTLSDVISIMSGNTSYTYSVPSDYQESGVEKESEHEFTSFNIPNSQLWLLNVFGSSYTGNNTAQYTPFNYSVIIPRGIYCIMSWYVYNFRIYANISSSSCRIYMKGNYTVYNTYQTFCNITLTPVN